jgi:electron transfer flavoprotein beta subunit
MGIKKAKAKEIRVISAARVEAGTSIERVYLPQKSKQSQIFSGEPKQAAQQLVEKLRFEARVL